jgi:hypothetical protein
LMLGWALLPEPLGFPPTRLRRSQFAGQSLSLVNENVVGTAT